MQDDEQLEQGAIAPNAELSNHAELSDDELLEQLAQNPDFTFQTEPEPQEVVEPEQTDPIDDAELELPEVTAEDHAEQATDPEDAQGTVQVEDAPVVAGTDPVATPNVTETQPPQVAPVEQATDHKAFYEAVTKTFKANGRELQVTNPEDIIALMQQGANYDKKMAAIKPALQVHRTLEKAGMLDPEKISFAIDLMAGKPEAVSKLIQDHGIDLYGMEGKADEYVPTIHMASERDVEVNHVLQDLGANPKFEETFGVLTAWDHGSQQTILEKPNMLYLFQEHKDAGIFDEITAKVQNERMFGRLKNVSDLEAYRIVGDSLYGGPSQGMTQTQPLAQSSVAPLAQAPVIASPTLIADPRVQVKQAQVAQKRVAAAAPRKVAGQAAPTFNPLAVSDDELEAIIARQERLM